MKRFSHPPTPLRDRLGVSLVELLVTMSIGGVVMALGMGMLHLMLRADNTLAESLQRRQTVSQLARTFRKDIHAAREVKPSQAQNDQEPPGLNLQLAAGHHVTYSAKKHVIHRVETRGEKTIQTEMFRFSAGTVFSFTTDDPRRAALVIQSPNPTSTRARHKWQNGPMRELKIQATPGRDHRFELAN